VNEDKRFDWQLIYQNEIRFEKFRSNIAFFPVETRKNKPRRYFINRKRPFSTADQQCVEYMAE